MKKYLYLITALVLFAVLGFTLNAAVAAPVFAQDEINDIFFNNVENWVDVDGSQDISQGDYFYGILHVQNIDGRISYTVWNEDNVLPGLDTFTGYFLTTVTGVTIEGGVQPHITLGPFTGGADPNSILSAAELASGVVLKMWTDSATKWTDFVSLGADIASSTDSTPWAAFTTIGGYWYTHAPLIPPVGAGNTVGHSFLGLKVVTNNSGLNFGSVNDPNESEINLNVDFVGQSEIQVNDNYWAFQSNDPAFILPVRCGDGIINQTGETCDPPGSNAGQPNECRQDCTYCGDGHLDAGEPCDDGNNVNGDGCSATCNIERCGDGIVGNSPGETCDPPGTPAGASGNICRNDCTVCGDGIKQTGEQCDDGNNISGDGCENNCTVTPICGDGIVGNTPGETCDPPGSNAGQPNECRADCTYCGDGYLDAGEQCDDGNNIDGDGCSANCTTEQVGACRMTGGNVTVNMDYVPGTYAEVEVQGGKNKKWYTVGGQVGAPQANDPSYGEWTHTQHAGFNGSFTFHAGTASAPPGTEISSIACDDPGWCVQARCAPFKQIFWDGIGTFKNEKGFSGSFPGCTVTPGVTLHYFRAHVGDFGEPGNNGKQKPEPQCEWTSGGVDINNVVFISAVPDTTFGDKGGQYCDTCPDYYEIEIRCTTDPASAVIYKIEDFIDGGNLQIHPEVGQQCPY